MTASPEKIAISKLPSSAVHCTCQSPGDWRSSKTNAGSVPDWLIVIIIGDERRRHNASIAVSHRFLYGIEPMYGASPIAFIVSPPRAGDALALLVQHGRASAAFRDGFGAAGRQLFDFAHIEANADGALLSASRIKGSVDALVLRDNDALGLGLRLAAHGPATWG